ncbi:diaminohydroxyphosphoribosylaminopyrimidine deaminase [Serratia symbiotica str. 'Cinara cedri']|nr:diaminohydroxyphosphoribosylaminopyrimidine deaminase [Serratia symbiotica str. 'Cinara cedri']
MHSDEFYMAHAFKLARLGRFTTAPNPNVGCVIVRNGVIVGEGYHLRAGEPHAEVHALNMAKEKAQGATAYTTLEPCSHYGRTPPCTDALVAAGISRVVSAIQDPNPRVTGRGLQQLRKAKIEVHYGLMSAEAEAINIGFLKRMRTGLPYVQLKLAISLDGRTAMASGQSQWISSSQARQDVQYLRAQSASILSTSATILADNPALTVRWNELDTKIQNLYPQKNLRQPWRIILDSQNRVTPQHRVVQQPGTTWLARLKPDKQVWPKNVEQLIFPAYNHGINLMTLMMQLAKRQVNSIWIEAGPKLSGSLLQSGLVDELIVYIAPKLLGDHSRGLCHLTGVEQLADAPEFIFNNIKQVGPDLRLKLSAKI